MVFFPGQHSSLGKGAEQGCEYQDGVLTGGRLEGWVPHTCIRVDRCHCKIGAVCIFVHLVLSCRLVSIICGVYNSLVSFVSKHEIIKCNSYT